MKQRAGEPLTWNEKVVLVAEELFPELRKRAMFTRFYRLRAPLSPEALSALVHAVAERQPALRTYYPRDGGKPRPVMLPSASVPVEQASTPIDAPPEAPGMRYWLEVSAELSEPIETSKAPALRAKAWPLPGDRQLLGLAVHHVAADAWSIDVLDREVQHASCMIGAGIAATCSVPRATYRDFAVEASRIASTEREAKAAYWLERFRGAPGVYGLVSGAAFGRSSATANRAVWTLPAPLTRGLQAFARAERMTVGMLGLAALFVVVAESAKRDDVIIAMGTHNRTQRFYDVIGCFANTLLIRCQFPPGASLRERVREVRRSVLAAYLNMLPDLELTVRRCGGVLPLTQLTFQYIPRPRSQYAQGASSLPRPLRIGPHMTNRGVESASGGELMVRLIDVSDGLIMCEMLGRTDVLGAHDVQVLREGLTTVLEAMVVAPDTRPELAPLECADANPYPARVPRAATDRGLLREVRACWREVIGVEGAQADTNFWAVGGDLDDIPRLVDAAHRRGVVASGLDWARSCTLGEMSDRAVWAGKSD